MNIKAASPCKGCNDRRLHCHSECESYIAFAKENEERRAQSLQDVKVYLALYDSHSRRSKSLSVSKSCGNKTQRI